MTELKPRELKLLKLVCDEYSNAEIATKLKIQLRSCEKIKSRLYNKTKTHTNIGLLKWAVLNGLYEIKQKKRNRAKKNR